MTAPKRIDLARIAAGVAEALEKVTVHQVTSVNAELEELLDGTRHIGISALIVIPAPRRRAAEELLAQIGEVIDDEPQRDPQAGHYPVGTSSTPTDDGSIEPQKLPLEETVPLPVVGEVPGPAPKGMKRGPARVEDPVVTRFFDDAEKPDAEPAEVEG